MSFLGAYPVLRIWGEEKHENPVGFVDAPTVAASDIMSEALHLAMVRRSSAVLILSAYVRPEKTAEAIWIDPDLLEATQVLGFPSRSVVTGLYIKQGAVLVPTVHLKNVATLPAPSLIAPHSVGDFMGNETPTLAFENGYANTVEAAETDLAARNRLALAASMGTEALNGGWWVLGAMSRLLPSLSLEEAWKRHEELLVSPQDMSQHLETEARRVRLETGVPVSALSHAKSRALKAMLPNWPPSDMWDRFAHDCSALGPDTQTVAQRYLRAAGRVWANLA